MGHVDRPSRGQDVCELRAELSGVKGRDLEVPFPSDHLNQAMSLRSVCAVWCVCTHVCGACVHVFVQCMVTIWYMCARMWVMRKYMCASRW